METQSKHPYIQSFFSCYALPEVRKEIKGLMEAATSDKVWKRKIPGNLLWLSDKLQELVSTVFTIDKWQEEERAIITPNWEDYQWPACEPALYCGWQKGYTTWHFMPRHLSKREFTNPYKALAKFKACYSEAEWKAIIYQLLNHALTPTSYEEFDHNHGMLQVEQLLYKLVEACHLIEVRTNERYGQQSTVHSP
jgi:hypothetical protein